MHAYKNRHDRGAMGRGDNRWIGAWQNLGYATLLTKLSGQI